MNNPVFNPGDIVECIEDSKWGKEYYGTKGQIYTVVSFHPRIENLIEISGPGIVKGDSDMAIARRFKLIEKKNIKRKMLF